MIPGWHYLEDEDPLPSLGSAAFLDVAGSMKGMQSPLRLCRLYYKGNPEPSDLAFRARYWTRVGCKIQLGNEPNNPIEGFTFGPDGYASLYKATKVLLPDTFLYWAAMSPDIPGWQQWYDGAGDADGIAIHAYGSYDNMQSLINYMVSRFPHKPMWVSECNFGPGPDVYISLDWWAQQHFKPFLAWCNNFAQVKAVSYFAYKWPNPDMSIGTPVDGAGTDVENILQAWEDDMADEATQATLNQLLQQNALLTEALVRFRKGAFEGAEGIDGLIVALTGKPLDFVPSYPPKV